MPCIVTNACALPTSMMRRSGGHFVHRPLRIVERKIFGVTGNLHTRCGSIPEIFLKTIII